MLLVKNYSLSVLVLCTSLTAMDLGTELNFVGGYRNDSLRRKNTEELIPPVVTDFDSIIIKNIDIGQIGLNARFKSLQMDPYCEWSLLSNFYLDGFAYWGWGGEGAKLHESNVALVLGSVEIGRAELDHIHTHDYQIGVGYFFDLHCLGIGISGGYAWNRQSIETKNGQTSLPPFTLFVEDPIFDRGYKTRTSWEGPWIGAEVYYDAYDWTLGLGYEFHLAHYYAQHTLSNNSIAQIECRANIAKSSHAYGNVGFFSVFYQFCEGWQFGAEFKYQNWFADHAKLKPLNTSCANIGLAETTRINAIGQWLSYSINLNLGYSF